MDNSFDPNSDGQATDGTTGAPFDASPDHSERRQYAGPSGGQAGADWTPPAASAPRGPRTSPFFDGLRRSGFYRTVRRVLGGVCGGIAAKTGCDVSLVRIVVLVAGLLMFPVVPLVYGAAWILLPYETDGHILLEDWTRG